MNLPFFCELTWMELMWTENELSTKFCKFAKKLKLERKIFADQDIDNGLSHATRYNPSKGMCKSRKTGVCFSSNIKKKKKKILLTSRLQRLYFKNPCVLQRGKEVLHRISLKVSFYSLKPLKRMWKNIYVLTLGIIKKILGSEDKPPKSNNCFKCC